MSDPLNDGRFLDRPQHPDFWRISEILLANDGDATEGRRSLEAITGSVVDLESLTYAAHQRAGIMCAALGLDPGLVGILATAWVDAFTAGAMFQQRGGKQ